MRVPDRDRERALRLLLKIAERNLQEAVRQHDRARKDLDAFLGVNTETEEGR